MKRMGRSLSEFAQQDENRNVMSRFLAEADIASFRFIGIQDYFVEDLQRLAKIMAWPSIKNRVHNATQLVKPPVSDKEYQLIEEANTKDLALYKEALALRLESLKTLREL